MTIAKGALLLGAFAVATAALADEPGALSEPIQVTATREPEPVDQIPASVTVITGESLRARGANDLRTALALSAGVEGTPGGDGGPAGAVPMLWGLREADAYLLVVDNVPWGGAFNPATPSLDLAGVERIEILRGAAPVMYGATSFSGVIHVIHYGAGQTPATVSALAGTNASFGVGTTLGGPSSGSFQQSLIANVEQRGYAEDDTEYQRYHVLYRGGAKLGSANFHVDGDVSVLPQKPAGNLLLRDGARVYDELPWDANYNPNGAKLNQKRFQLAVGLDGKGGLGDWAVTLAGTRTLDDIFRGFLRGGVFDTFPPNDGGVGDGLQADGAWQHRGITDVYFDAHVVTDLASGLRWTWGFDYLYGYGMQHGANFGYCIDRAGNEFGCPGARHDDEPVMSSDERHFSGLYTQFDWKAADSLDVLAGLRVNRARESAEGVEVDNTGVTPVVTPHPEQSTTHTRLSGTLGAAWHVARALTLYADYRNSFKPLAVDFGPEAEADVLQPETAQSYEAGAKTQLLDGKLDIDTSVFQMDFKNGLTFNGGLRANGGETRFRGGEIEGTYAVLQDLKVAAHAAYHDARFIRFTLDNGVPVDGNQFEMSPYCMGGAGLMFTPATGFNAALVADYVGPRKLNKSNSVTTGGYAAVDASLGWRFERVALALNGYNLTNKHVPVAESELQEHTVTGTAGYYRLPATSVVLTASMPLP